MNLSKLSFLCVVLTDTLHFKLFRLDLFLLVCWTSLVPLSLIFYFDVSWRGHYFTSSCGFHSYFCLIPTFYIYEKKMFPFICVFIVITIIVHLHSWLYLPFIDTKLITSKSLFLLTFLNVHWCDKAVQLLNISLRLRGTSCQHPYMSSSLLPFASHPGSWGDPAPRSN